MEITRELRSSCSKCSSWNSSTYRWRVKPSKLAISLPVLKEATTSTAIGIYRKIKIRMVKMRFVFFMR